MDRRRTFPKEFRRKVAMAVDPTKKNFTGIAIEYGVSAKQAKGYWLEYQAELNEEYTIEIKALRRKIKILEKRIAELK
jgi:transposase-like protein